MRPRAVSVSLRGPPRGESKVPAALPVTLESSLPASLPSGSSIALYCSGTAICGGSPPHELSLLADGARHRLESVAMPRVDMPWRRSGFWGILPVRRVSSPGPLIVRAELKTRRGELETVEIAKIEVTGEPGPPAGHGPPPQAVDSAHPLIAVCMGTFNPPPALLEAQLSSLRAQTDQAWVCVISDDCSSPDSYRVLEELIGGDPRFLLTRAPCRIGFYRNFERALTLAPANAPLIALSDQDDVWHPEKLAQLRASLGEAVLVYSDQRLVDSHGRVLRETMWRGRANNYTSLASMLMANSVTGAASLLRREVLERALPFPDSPGIEFHDHWLALVALASGKISYLDRPLYDYVQHEAAVLGKVLSPRTTRQLRRPRMQEWRAAYFLGYMPGKVRAHTLLLRFGDALEARKRRDLERYLATDSSLLAFLWLVLRPLRRLLGRNETLGTEWELARGVLWRRLAGVSRRIPGLPDRLLIDCRFPDPPHYEQRGLQRWRSRI